VPTLDRTLRDIRQGQPPSRELLLEIAEAEDTPFLIDLAAGLEDPHMAQSADPAHLRATFNTIERVLALTPSRACAEAALIVYQMRREHTRPPHGYDPTMRQRRAAEWLASAQSPQTLLDILALHQDPATSIAGLVDPLVHELIIRGIDHPIIGAHLERQYAAGHPLGVLTPRLTPLEKGISARLPDHDVRTSITHLDWTRFSAPHPTPAALTLSVTQTTTEAHMMRMQRAAEGLILHSNGDGLAHTFTIMPPLPDTDGARELARLLLDLDIGYDGGFTLTTAPGAFALLFGYAAGGGAYGGAQYGAYGRLRAWESLAGLAGFEQPASIDDIQQVALTARWGHFSAEWFHRAGWDIGLLCVHAGGRACAVLAVTDQD
jgi:hypothetical protein